MNKIIQGDCLEKLKDLEDNSVDSIVTDPPYHLVSIVKRFGKEGSAPAQFGTDGAFARASKGFMGKQWDGVDENGIGIAQNVELWKECLRVLKPGGHLLAFSGTRTYHRMASAIEDAGFEVRDMIEWVYGCLSEDTEVLTKDGFKHFHKITQDDIIRVYDTQNDIYKWEKPQRWSKYSVEQDTAYRIKSDTTDQIVSRNHNCLVEREGKLVFVKSEDLLQMERVPVLSGDISILQEGQGELLHQELLWQGEGLDKTILSERTGQEASRNGIEWREEPSVERGSYLQKEKGEICRPENQVCEMSEGVSNNGEKGRVCNGTQIESRTGDTKTTEKDGVCSSHQSQCNGQQDTELNAIQDKRGTQEIRTRTTYNTTLATIEKIEYTGTIFCPTVSTGAFVARRNDQVFITGNSGFPKSLNIGKAVDKLQGNEREEYIDEDFLRRNPDTGQSEKGIINKGHFDGLEGAKRSKGNSEWEGWGTALKPAHEPICMARKPLQEKTVAENCLKWGTGGINIDESRVGEELMEGRVSGKTSRAYQSEETTTAGGKGENHIGRFPANLCWSCDCDNNYLTGNALFDILSNISNQIKLCQSNNSNSNALNVEQKKHQQDTTSEEKKLCFAVENVDTLFLEKILGKTLEVIFSVNTECSVEMLKESMNTSLSISLSGNEKMEEYQKVLKFITLTATRLITELKTCNLSQSQIIGSFITKVISGIREQSQVKSHSPECWVRECFPETKTGAVTQKAESVNSEYAFSHNMITHTKERPSDSGNASRFFKSIIYQPKASRSERNKGMDDIEAKEWKQENSPNPNREERPFLPVKNNHPTVKPIALMEYLIKMVTPKGGVVLDPFAGSGSTLVAAKQNGFQYIGIEREEEYIKIIEARLK